VVRKSQERKGKVCEYLQKLGESLGLNNSEDIIAEILSSIPIETSFEGILKGCEKKKMLNRKLKGFFRLESNSREEIKDWRKKEKEEMLATIAPLYMEIGVTETDARKLRETFHFGPTVAQYRWWKSKVAASFALSKSPGGRGYVWDLEDAVRSLYNKEDMTKFSQQNGTDLPLILSVDGGSVDHSNSMIFVKLVRSDLSWTNGNRHKVPSLAATLATLYMKEEPAKILEELGQLFKKINKLPVKLQSEEMARIIILTHSNDAKMSCILFGNPNAYCTRSGRPCFRCTASRGT